MATTNSSASNIALVCSKGQQKDNQQMSRGSANTAAQARLCKLWKACGCRLLGVVVEEAITVLRLRLRLLRQRLRRKDVCALRLRFGACGAAKHPSHLHTSTLWLQEPRQALSCCAHSLHALEDQ